jgi:thiol-disulfide isomerase/thioredoxin
MRNFSGVLVLLLFAGPVAAQTPDAKVAVKAVKYAELADMVRQRAGKVVVIDFWSDTCIPCKKRFPHLVEMANKYASQGLAVISVSVDADPQKKETQERALKFLQKVNAAFPNVMLDEPIDFWTEKFGIKEIPCVFVFNREGKWVRLSGDEITSEDVEKLVVDLLKQK